MFEQTLFYNQLKKESLEKKILLMIRLITERRDDLGRIDTPDELKRIS